MLLVVNPALPSPGQHFELIWEDRMATCMGAKPGLALLSFAKADPNALFAVSPAEGASRLSGEKSPSFKAPASC